VTFDSIIGLKIGLAKFCDICYTSFQAGVMMRIKWVSILMKKELTQLNIVSANTGLWWWH
jgi:hypothetical protein